jgi:hypothetical protein
LFYSQKEIHHQVLPCRDLDIKNQFLLICRKMRPCVDTGLVRVEAILVVVPAVVVAVAAIRAAAAVVAVEALFLVGVAVVVVGDTVHNINSENIF